MEFVSRAGHKLEHAMNVFNVAAEGQICADLGSNTGGFVECLLNRGAARVYSVDTGYGVLAWTLRKDPRVVVMERTNAIHVELPEKVSLITIDVAWTRQRIILPAAKRLLAADGRVVTLIKPHYESHASMLRKGILPIEQLPGVLEAVKSDIVQAGFELLELTESPIQGAKGNNELLALLRLQTQTAAPA